MPIYRLEPIDDHLSDSRWEASTLRDGCWVRAENEQAARLRVELVTLQFVEFDPDQGTRFSPWRDPDLTECYESEPTGLEVPEGIVVGDDGHTYSLESGPGGIGGR